MFKLFKSFSICMLICMAFFIKGLILIEPFLLEYTKDNLISIEYFSYCLNALLFLVGFSVVEKNIRSYFTRAIFAILASMGTVVSIGAENYFYQSYKCMMIGWYDWDFYFFSRQGIANYSVTGEPGYHWVFIVMTIMCIMVVILRAKTENIISPFKNWLVKRAKKTHKSIYFHLLLRTFVKHISLIDYMDLKEIYENEEIEISLIHREISPLEFEKVELYFEYEVKKSHILLKEIFPEELAQIEAESKNKEQVNADEICESEEESKDEQVDDDNNSSNDIKNNEKKPVICIRGDTHGDINAVKGVANQLELTENDTLIIAGDFGFIFNASFDEELILNELATLPFTLCFIDGNHENHPAIFRYPEEMWNGGKVHKIRDNIFHMMRGQVFEIEGKKIFTMGGAYSVDRMFRKLNVSYWEEEIPNAAEMAEARSNLERHNYEVDYIITHTLPSSVKLLMGYEVSQEHEEDADFTDFLDEVREKTSYKRWFAGHFHMNKIVSPADNMIVLYEGVQILD